MSTPYPSADDLVRLARAEAVLAAHGIHPGPDGYGTQALVAALRVRGWEPEVRVEREQTRTVYMATLRPRGVIAGEPAAVWRGWTPQVALAFALEAMLRQEEAQSWWRRWRAGTPSGWPRRCAECGEPLAAGDRFCPACGAAGMPPEATRPAPPRLSPPTLDGWLVPIGGAALAVFVLLVAIAGASDGDDPQAVAGQAATATRAAELAALAALQTSVALPPLATPTATPTPRVLRRGQAPPRLAPSPTASPTPEPTAKAEPTAVRPTPLPDPTASTDWGAGRLADLLPAEDEVPAGLAQTVDSTRTLAEVSRHYRDPSETVRRFAAWGWEGNAVRRFARSASGAPRGTPSSLFVSIHRFESADAAGAALDYVLSDEAAVTGWRETSVPTLGDGARALIGTTQSGSAAALAVRRDRVLIWVTTTVPGGDPLAVAEAVVEVILAK